jgi:hypothetical protein
LDVLAIPNQQSLLESERRGSFYRVLKLVAVRKKKWPSSASGHHVVIYVTAAK